MPVTIYLVNGIRLVGEIESYDQYGLLIDGNSRQFVYKHAISTILPSRDVADSARSEVTAVPEGRATATLRPRKASMLRAHPNHSPTIKEPRLPFRVAYRQSL